jgi:putative peptide zinc metalloprotease protein
MNSAVAEPESASQGRQRRFTLRADLRIEAQIYAGELSYVIKDPISLTYFRFRPAEHDVLRLLNGKTPREICSLIRTKLNRPEPKPADIDDFLQRLASSGLVVFDGGGQGEVLLAQAQAAERAQKRSWVGSLLYIQFSGFDPTAIMNRVYPLMKWMYSRWAVAAAVTFILFSIGFSIVNAEELFRRVRDESLGQFFSAETLFWLWMAIGVSKVLHEFGHGLTCKHFGGECHDMGMLLLVFSPCLYCDATDAWTMPNKWHRIAISAGGIYVELLIASAASLTWWFTGNGVIHNIALALMTICSLNTFFLNANPLMRYDGYYLLSDFLEIPNLRARAFGTLQGWIDRVLLGLPSQSFSDGLSHGRRMLFYTYAILAWAYRWVLCAMILWMFYYMLKPYGLSDLSVGLAIAVGIQIFVVPIWRNVMRVVKQATTTGKVRWWRVGISGVVLAGLAYAAVVVPIPRRVNAAFAMQGRDQHPVHAPVAGRIESIEARPGQQVSKGGVLVRLANPALDMQVEELANSLAMMKLNAASYRAGGHIGEEQAVLEVMKSTEKELEQLRKMQSQLVIQADRDGRVVPAVRAIPPAHESRGYRDLGSWRETPLHEENLGARIDVGAEICELQPSAEMEAVLYVEQSEIPFLNRDPDARERVRLKLDAFPIETLWGEVREVSRLEAEDAPKQLLVDGGGLVPTTRGADGRNELWTTYYVVRVALDLKAGEHSAEVEAALRAGCRGRAKIECGRTTCWEVARRKFHQIFFL